MTRQRPSQSSVGARPEGLRLRMPATSANLGPGFDTVGLAFSLWLEVKAEVAEDFSVRATGRNVDLVQSLERNLILDTYRQLAPHGPRLALEVDNQLPLGMGCGSSAAALVAGVRLANHFGQLGWTEARMLDDACRREGHPDNVAACFLGGFTVSSMNKGTVSAATFGANLSWPLLLAIPRASLATEKARALLPPVYDRSAVVENIQATALLVSAFALDRPDLLLVGTQDRLHQPYRQTACPLLGALLPLAGQDGIASVTLSGAGPSVLLILERGAEIAKVRASLERAGGELVAEVVEACICGGTK